MPDLKNLIPADCQNFNDTLPKKLQILSSFSNLVQAITIFSDNFNNEFFLIWIVLIATGKSPKLYLFSEMRLKKALSQSCFLCI